jgi:hypothetical protein
MNHLRICLPTLAAAAVLLSGCAQKYTRHMSETYKDKKIDSVTFGVVSLPELTYTPPSSCMSGEGKAGDGPKYRKEWEAKMIKSLSASFKKQRFVSIPSEGLEELGISAPSFFSAAEADIEKMGVAEYEANGGEERKIDYQPSRPGGTMRAWGAKLKEKDSVDYIIALVQPKMTGETHTSYGANGQMTTTTTYTTNVRFGIWSAESGELAYASGAIAASSGFCFFVSPQSASIDGNAGDISTQLKALITAFLNRMPGERLQVGQAPAAAADGVQPALQ